VTPYPVVANLLAPLQRDAAPFRLRLIRRSDSRPGV
jgi:hypothetical protein